VAAAKRRLTLPAALARELQRLAQRKGKNTVAVLRDLVTENMESIRRRDTIPLNSNTILTRARRLRVTPKNIRLDDQLLFSRKRVSKGMPTDKLCQNQKAGRNLKSGTLTRRYEFYSSLSAPCRTVICVVGSPVAFSSLRI
jgi:hypothetical protein